MHILMLSAFVALAAGTVGVRAHAIINSPAVRIPGPHHLEVCGETSYDRLVLDPSGHIEEQLPIASGACALELCRGMLFEDQPVESIQRVVPGQQMAMQVNCTIPHGGPANVTLLDTTIGGHGQVIGSFLKTFDNFCPTSGGTPADQSNLQFTLPTADEIGGACQDDGDCVVQLFWATPDLSQNYYYCIDVTVGLAVQPTTSSEQPVSSMAEPAASPSTTSTERPTSSTPPVGGLSSTTSTPRPTPSSAPPGGAVSIRPRNSILFLVLAAAVSAWAA